MVRKLVVVLKMVIVFTLVEPLELQSSLPPFRMRVILGFSLEAIVPLKFGPRTCSLSSRPEREKGLEATQTHRGSSMICSDSVVFLVVCDCL